MAWLDFIKNGNELSEWLIEGNNPYGVRKLTQGDVDQLRDHVKPTERVLAYVLGRVVFEGRGLWLLTDHQLLISEGDQSRSVIRVPLESITAAECVKGKYGYTLRVQAAGRQHSVYGAASQMTAQFYQLLGQKVTCSPVVKPMAVSAEDQLEVQQCFLDAASRLQPVVPAL